MKRWVLSTVLAALCCGCGAKQSTGPSDSNTPDGSVSPEVTRQYIEVVTKVTPQIQSMASKLTEPLKSPDAIVELLRATPGISAVDAADTSGNAVFAHIGSPDGPIYAVLWRSMQVNADTAELGDTSAAQALNKIAADNGIPPGSKVQLFSALDGRGYPNWIPKAKQVFDYSKNNYTATSQSATIENLRNIKNADVMIFYTHGVMATASKNVFLMATTNPFDPTLTTTTYKDDWDKFRLASANVAIAEIPWTEPAKRWKAGGPDEMATLFCIKSEFVDQYWTFGDNSLVILDACYSLAPAIQSFRNSVYAKNASVIWGWTGRGHSNLAEKSTLMMLDRLLGTNIVKPVQEPLQRPFDRELVMEAVRKAGIESWIDEGSISMKSFKENPAAKKMGLLAPTIKYLKADENAKKLTITGTFGEDQSKGKVTINDNERSILSWANEEVECELKPEDCGPVVVSFADHKSNKVNLTKWEVKLKYEATGPQALSVIVNSTVRWRADLHAFREKPEEGVSHHETTLLPTRDSHSEYSAKGTSTMGTDATVTYSGGASLSTPYTDEGAAPTKTVFFWAEHFPSDTTKLKVWCKFIIYPGYTATYKNDKGTEAREHSIGMPKEILLVKEAYAPQVIDFEKMLLAGSMPLEKEFSFDAEYGIKAGKCGPVVVSGSDGKAEFLLSWEACTPEHPPLKNGRL